MRKEKDFLGTVNIKNNALYGVNSVRAKENFLNDTKFHKEWYAAMGTVKLACYQTYAKLKNTALNKLKKDDIRITFFQDKIIEALIKAATEVSQGKHFNDFIVPAVQGGAGTSINMNINEIIANRALILLKSQPGNYKLIDPFNHANIFQSTNDVVPTALKLAVMKQLNILEESINNTRNISEKNEKKFDKTVRIAYTQMQEAMPSSYGILFSTYNDSLSRDWWRVSKCFERIKQINLGGGAIGTGNSIPRFFIMEASQNLQRITGLPLTRSENLSDTTANQDAFVEIHAILKAHAVNLEKISNDIRLLAADISKEPVSIEARQVGSSIMPGKINPVIPEYAISVAHKVYANDMLISNLAGQTCLDLNPNIPLIGHAVLESIKLLISANKSIADYLLKNIDIEKKSAYEMLVKSGAITSALIPYCGYGKASKIAKFMKKNNCDVFEANKNLKYIDDKTLSEILLPQNLLKLGFSVNKNK